MTQLDKQISDIKRIAPLGVQFAMIAQARGRQPVVAPPAKSLVQPSQEVLNHISATVPATEQVGVKATYLGALNR